LETYKAFYAGATLLTGSFPMELTEIDALEDLVIYENPMTGTLPTEVGKLTNLFGFLPCGNLFSGMCYHFISL